MLKNCLFGTYRAPATKLILFKELGRTPQPSEFAIHAASKSYERLPGEQVRKRSAEAR
jgi:hypothetical protein